MVLYLLAYVLAVCPNGKYSLESPNGSYTPGVIFHCNVSNITHRFAGGSNFNTLVCVFVFSKIAPRVRIAMSGKKVKHIYGLQIFSFVLNNYSLE